MTHEFFSMHLLQSRSFSLLKKKKKKGTKPKALCPVLTHSLIFHWLAWSLGLGWAGGGRTEVSQPSALLEAELMESTGVFPRASPCSFFGHRGYLSVGWPWGRINCRWHGAAGLRTGKLPACPSSAASPQLQCWFGIRFCVQIPPRPLFTSA